MGFLYTQLGAENLRDEQTLDVGGIAYVLSEGILRQLFGYEESQEQSRDTYQFLWQQEQHFFTAANIAWHKYIFANDYYPDRVQILERFLHKGARVLDAGCGAGISACVFFEEYLDDIQYVGIEISRAVDIANKHFRQRGIAAEFLQADFNAFPIQEPIFDFIFCHGVLLHTSSVSRSIANLARLLKPGAGLAFWTLKEPPPVRKLVDQYLRNVVCALPSRDEALRHLLPLTKFAESLSRSGVEVEVPEEIPILGIPKGKLPLQMFFHYFLLKMFHNPEFTIERNNLQNFDWYGAANCHAHTEPDLRAFVESAGLALEYLRPATQTGFTGLAIKK